jgi:type VI secretion system protein VasG
LQKNKGPLCSLLFAGSARAGKKAVAQALTTYLYKEADVFYSAPLTASLSTITELKLQPHTHKNSICLKDLIQQKPYAIILLDRIEEASKTVLADIQEIVSTGYLHDATGQRYYFQQAILILCTHLGDTQLKALANTFSTENIHAHLDLIHLVMGDQKQNASPDITPQALTEAVQPILTTQLSDALCQTCTIVPFLPLNQTAVEKIIRSFCKRLGKILETRYNIELGYAPEVIRFLTQASIRNETAGQEVIDLSIASTQLYAIVEQALLQQAGNKNRPLQLCLQLNETGHALQCDCLTLPHAVAK